VTASARATITKSLISARNRSQDTPSGGAIQSGVSALMRIATGDELIVITWLDRADRSVLQVHPQGNPKNPLTGVFATRSPHRPNPLGIHRVKVASIDGTTLRIGPIEAIDGTPVVDVKIALDRS